MQARLPINVALGNFKNDYISWACGLIDNGRDKKTGAKNRNLGKEIVNISGFPLRWYVCTRRAGRILN